MAINYGAASVDPVEDENGAQDCHDTEDQLCFAECGQPGYTHGQQDIDEVIDDSRAEGYFDTWQLQLLSSLMRVLGPNGMRLLPASLLMRTQNFVHD